MKIPNSGYENLEIRENRGEESNRRIEEGLTYQPNLKKRENHCSIINMVICRVEAKLAMGTLIRSSYKTFITLNTRSIKLQLLGSLKFLLVHHIIFLPIPSMAQSKRIKSIPMFGKISLLPLSAYITT